MLILAIIALGAAAGWIAQLLLGKGGRGIDWGLALVAGLVGSFVGGLLGSLLFGDGLEIRPSGIIGSIVGAVIVTAIWQWFRGRSQAKARAEAHARSRSGNPQKRSGRS